MKLVFALALLIASVTVFGATAQRSPIENELEELDLLLNLDSGNYALDGLVSKIREGLQHVLDRVKSKLGEHKELFEQFRAKIEEVQEKIRDLVKQGGARLAQLVSQIREKLQALIKGVFDKIKDNAEFYEAEEEEKSILQRIVEKVKELVQRGLDRLKERLAKFKDVAEQFKDKFAEIQEKLKEVGKDFSIKALDKIHEVREKLRDLLREVTQKIAESIKGSQYVAYGVEELAGLLPEIKAYVFSDEGFATIRSFAKTVQSSNPIVNFVKLFVNSQSDDYLKTVLAELFGNVYAAQYAMPVAAFKRVRDILITDEGIAAIRKFGKGLQSDHQIVTQVAGLLSTVPDAELKRVINELFNGLLAGQYETLDQDIAEYYEGESLLEIIGQRLRELAQKALEALKTRIAQAKEVSELVKEKLQVLQEQIAQLGKEAGAKAVALFQKIRQNIIEVLKGIQSKISETALYEEEEEQGSLISRIAKRIADLAQRALNKLREKLAPHKEFFEQLRTKISEVQAKIAELGKTVGAKALEVAKSLREKIRDLAKQIKEKLAGVTYADEEEDKQPLLTRLAQRIRAVVERIVVIIKGKLAESKELFGEFKEKLDDVTAKLAELGKKTGQKALDAARELREKVRELNKAIVQRIKDKISGALYAAEDEEEDQSIGELIKQKIRQIVESVRAVVQRVVETLKEKLGQSKELLGQFKERINEITSGLKELSKKTAQEALQAIAELRRKALDLARDIKKAITGEEAYYEAEEEEEVEQGLVQRIVQRVRDLVQRVLQKIKETLANREQIAEQVKDKIAEITKKLAELAKEKGAKALKAVEALRQKLRDLVKNIRDKIAGQGYYAGEESDDDEEIDETKPSLIKRLVDRIRSIVERSVERIQERLATQKELLAEFKDKIDEVNKGLADLAKQSGIKALEAARALRKKVEGLAKAVIARITGKDALYAAEDEEEDQSIGQLIEKKLRELAERIRTVVQRVLETLKEKLGESKELVAKFGDRIQTIKTALAELTKKGAKEALQALAELRRKVFDLARDIKKSITGEEALYESEVVEEEVSTSLVQRIIQRVRALVQRVLQKVKETLANREEIAAQFKEKIAEITKKLTDLAKEKGAKALQAIQALRQKLRDLVKNIREKIAPSGYSTYALREDLIAIRDIVTRPEGLQRLKAYLNNLKTSHPTVALVRAYVDSVSDDALLEILKEFFSGFDGIILEDYPITDLAELFGNVRKEILTDDGIQKLRDYAKNIETSHPVVSRIKIAIEERPTENIRAFLNELFSGLDF